MEMMGKSNPWCKVSKIDGSEKKLAVLNDVERYSLKKTPLRYKI